MAGLSEDKARLAALHPEAVGEHRGIIGPPVRRVGVNLGVEDLQFLRMGTGLPPVEQFERYVGRGHDHLLYSGLLPEQPGAPLTSRIRER